MRKIIVLFLSALILQACSSSGGALELGQPQQQPCKSETPLTNPQEFTGETVQNLMVFKQGNSVMASMDVRTYCNARITFEIEKNSDQIKLKLRNANTATDDCVCETNVSTSVMNLEAGDYTFMITNAAGTDLLAEQRFTVTE